MSCCWILAKFLLLLFLLSLGATLRPPRRQLKGSQPPASSPSGIDDSPAPPAARSSDVLPIEKVNSVAASPVVVEEKKPLAVSSSPIFSRRDRLRQRGRKRPTSTRRTSSSAVQRADVLTSNRRTSTRRNPTSSVTSNSRTGSTGRRTKTRRTRPLLSSSISVDAGVSHRTSSSPAPEEATQLSETAPVVVPITTPRSRNRSPPSSPAPSAEPAPTVEPAPSAPPAVSRSTSNSRRRPASNGARGSGGSRSPSNRLGVTRRPIQPSTTTQTPEYDTECPEKNGYFADAFQCDRYYECSNNRLTEKLCPDGLVFHDFSSLYERCDFMHGVNCSGREALQPAKPSGICPRQNGYYPHTNPAVCDKFVQCVDGKANPLNCPANLVFSSTTGTCQWPDQAGRSGCGSEDVLNFRCPYTEKIDVTKLAPGQPLHPRFADPDDCQFFYACIEGVIPRRHGCQRGRVFNELTKNCDQPENVPECYDGAGDAAV